MTLSEKDTKIFKRWLKLHLQNDKVTVIFTKKDGTERTMLCTTKAELIPSVVHDPTTDTVEKPARKVNDDSMAVYDLEAAGWRSFRWDSIKQVRLDL